jgi:hypothetical protein
MRRRLEKGIYKNTFCFIFACIFKINYFTMKTLSPDQQSALLQLLHTRFEKNTRRHPGLAWADVKARLEKQPEKLWTLQQMEETGGEPDVIGRDAETGEILFADCAPETPKGRRSLCYDRAAWESRKEFKPTDNAVDAASAMGIELLSETDYLALQQCGPFDTKTSSWLLTPADVRKLGGALFGDYRFGRTFIYHNGAESYYAVRGFRGKLRV